MAVLVLALAGSALGSAIGGTLGASIGFAAGEMLGNALFPQKIEGPRTRPMMAQSSAYGTPLPVCYGCIRVAGTVIWQAPIREVASTEGGKGGPEVTTYSYFGTFALALCAGPILRVNRIWANGICIFDCRPEATQATRDASATWMYGHLAFYAGDESQQPDATMEAALGVGNVPAYRGTAYIVLSGLALENYGNMLPSINVEVVRAGELPGRIWENDALGTPSDWTRIPYPTATWIARIPLITAISPQIRVINRAVDGSATTDDHVALIDPDTGAYLGDDTQNAFESAIVNARGLQDIEYYGYPSEASAYTAYSGSNVYCLMVESTGTYYIGARTTDGGITLDAEPRYSQHDHFLAVFASGGTTVVSDILPVLTPAPDSTYGINGVIPCADRQHFVVHCESDDHYYWHLMRIDSSTGACTEIEVYTWDITPIIEDEWRSVSSTCGGTYSYNSIMLESDLSHFWFTDIWFNASISRYEATPTGLRRLVYCEWLWEDVGLPYRNVSIYADNGRCYAFAKDRAVCWGVGELTLGEIVTDLCERCGVEADAIDATDLTDSVFGYAIDRQMTGRAAIETLATPWYFDVVESDGLLKFRHRNGTSVATIALDDMVVDAAQSPSPLGFTRGSEIEMPSQVNLTYYAQGADYQAGVQYARRLSTKQASNVQTVDSAMVMDDAGASIAAWTVLWDAWAGRTSFKFSSTYALAQLEPSDVVTIETGDESYLVRLTRKTENGGTIEWEGVGCAPVYGQISTHENVRTQQAVRGDLSTTAYVLDLPPLRDSDGYAPTLYIAMCGAAGWPGGVLLKSSDGGATFGQALFMGTPAIIGTLDSATHLSGAWGGGNTFDEGSTVTVTLLDSELELASASELAVLNNANVALLGDEIIQFKNAALVVAGQYTLTGLLRGRLGTEAAIATHYDGERFVLLTGPLGILVTTAAEIGQARVYQAVTIRQPIGSGDIQTITETGATLMPFSPVYLHGAPAGNGDVLLTWIRRNRLAWQWMPWVDVPMSEDNEAYVVTILDGDTAVRTIDVAAAQTATYTAAQQTTDFGAPVSTLKWGVQQVSAVTGPGLMATATSSGP